MTTDPIRALLLEMADELDHSRQWRWDDRRLTHPLADRARAALAAASEVGELGVQDATALFMETYAAARTVGCHPNSTMGKHQRRQAALAAVLAADRQRRAQPPQGEEVG